MYLNDGFSTLVVINFDHSNISLTLREREVQPPALDTGGPIEITTMRNKYMRTFAAKQLVSLGILKITCQYDPKIYFDLLTRVTDNFSAGEPPPGRPTNTRLRIGANAQITVVFPDAQLLTFRGYIDKITPPSHKEGEFPLMEVEIVPTNTYKSETAKSTVQEHIPTNKPAVAGGYDA